MIVSYTLDCGCEFKQKPQQHNYECYEIAKTCFAHSLSSPPEQPFALPPDPMPYPNVVPVMSAVTGINWPKRQAPNGPVISTLGELLGTSPMDERNRHDLDHTVCESKAALMQQCADELGIKPVAVPPYDISNFGKPLPMQQTNSRFEAKVEARVEEAMEHLEHTQPIPRLPPELPGPSRKEFMDLCIRVDNLVPGLAKAMVSGIRERIEAIEARLPPQER